MYKVQLPDVNPLPSDIFKMKQVKLYQKFAVQVNIVKLSVSLQMIFYVKLVHISVEPDWIIQTVFDVHQENTVVSMAWIMMVTIVLLDINVKEEISTRMKINAKTDTIVMLDHTLS